MSDLSEFAVHSKAELLFPAHLIPNLRDLRGPEWRELVDRVAALREQARVTKPGGRIVCLETTPPGNSVFGPLFAFYFFRIVPLIGGLISGDPHAYAYLPHGTLDFPAPHTLQQLMEEAGLHHVFYQELMGGAVAIHVGVKVAEISHGPT